MILTCTCRHPGQDKLHGENRRVHNETKAEKPKIYRCTVCQKTRAASTKVEVKEKVDVTKKRK